MHRRVKSTQSLLHDTRHTSQSPATDSAEDTDTPEALNVAPISQWTVFKFIMLTPMGCSRWIAFLLILVGFGSSIGTGIGLAYAAKYSGQLTQAVVKKDTSQYDTAFSDFIVVIAVMAATQGLSTYCMKWIGLMKRIHLCRTLHSSYFGGVQGQKVLLHEYVLL
jgi:hypothetical protein